MSDTPYTKKQGQYLAYIYTYTLLHRRPPSHADMTEFFGVTPPSVVSMLDRLQSRDLIAREPGVARSVRVLLAQEELPSLVGPDEVAPDGPQRPTPDIGLDDAWLPEDLAPIYQLRIDLDHGRPPIWRRVLVPAHITFEDLHAIIQAAMGWAGYHMHIFTAQGWDIGAPEADEPWMSETLEEDVEVVSDYLTDVGDRVKYEYDFGDGWMHTIKLERITVPDPKQHYPVCIKGRRACPPDDVGGIWGYTHLLEVIGDPSDPEYDEMAEWIGGTFDAEAFSLVEVNARLGAIETRPVDVSTRYSLGGPHVLTIHRWEMMAPDLPWHRTIMATMYDPPADLEDEEQRIQEAESPQALVERFWDVTPWLSNVWSARVASYGASCMPFLVEAFGAVDRSVGTGNPAWHRDQLILALTRLGAPAIPALLEIYASAPQVSRTLICVALGRLGAREHAELIWKELEDNLVEVGTGGLVGPLWALIDLGDPRAADVLSELLDEGYEFRELWAMLSRAGDARALLPLIVGSATAFGAIQIDVTFALAAIVRRLGRDASIEALMDLEENLSSGSMPFSVANLVDVILLSLEEEVAARFSPYYQAPSQEDMVELVRHLIEHDWDDEDDPKLFDDDPFSGYDDATDSAEGLFSVPGQLTTGYPPHSRYPNGRPAALPGRNEPCWCGSGKKYKHCHWREDHLGDTG